MNAPGAPGGSTTIGQILAELFDAPDLPARVRATDRLLRWVGAESPPRRPVQQTRLREMVYQAPDRPALMRATARLLSLAAPAYRPHADLVRGWIATLDDGGGHGSA